MQPLVVVVPQPFLKVFPWRESKGRRVSGVLSRRETTNKAMNRAKEDLRNQAGWYIEEYRAAKAQGEGEEA